MASHSLSPPDMAPGFLRQTSQMPSRSCPSTRITTGSRSPLERRLLFRCRSDFRLQKQSKAVRLSVRGSVLDPLEQLQGSHPGPPLRLLPAHLAHFVPFSWFWGFLPGQMVLRPWSSEFLSHIHKSSSHWPCSKSILLSLPPCRGATSSHPGASSFTPITLPPLTLSTKAGAMPSPSCLSCTASCCSPSFSYLQNLGPRCRSFADAGLALFSYDLQHVSPALVDLV